MKELNELINDINEQSEELLEHLDENLADYDEFHQELKELERQRIKMYHFMMTFATMSALYSLMLVMKTIMIAIQ